MIYLFEIAQFILSVLTWVILIQAVLSWLVAFNVINTSNQFVRQTLYALERITDPIYAPVRRVLPDFGALDLSPLVVLLLIQLIQRLLSIAYAQQAGGYVVVS
jgi:YggT family protein